MKRKIAILLSSLLCISSVGCSKSNDSDVVATVNGENITVKEYKSTLELYKENLESMYGTSIWDTEVEKGVKYKDTFKNIMLFYILHLHLYFSLIHQMLYQPLLLKELNHLF